MLKEALEEFKSQALATLSPQIVTFDPKQNLAYRNGAGEVILRPKDVSRSHAIESLEDLAAFATRFEGDDMASFWFDDRGVVFVVDDSIREDRARLVLPKSPQWLAVVDLAKGKALSQRDLIQLLRTTFRDCLTKAGNIVDIIRQIRFKQSAEGTSDVQRGKSSIGKTIMQQVEGTADLPEYVTLNVPFWANRVLVYVDVECSLDADEATQHFKLVPIPGKIERATDFALDELESRLRSAIAADVETKFPVYRGSVE